MALTKCRECGNEVSTSAGACPKCGAAVRPKSRPFATLFLLLILGSFVWVVAHNAPSEGSSSAGVAQSASKADLQAKIDSFSADQYGMAHISGSLTNTAGHPLKYVQVELNLYDDKGDQVGSTLANANNVETGASWRFEAPVFEKRATSAKVAGVTAF